MSYLCLDALLDFFGGRLCNLRTSCNNNSKMLVAWAIGQDRSTICVSKFLNSTTLLLIEQVLYAQRQDTWQWLIIITICRFVENSSCNFNRHVATFVQQCQTIVNNFAQFPKHYCSISMNCWHNRKLSTCRHYLPTISDPKTWSQTGKPFENISNEYVYNTVAHLYLIFFV